MFSWESGGRCRPLVIAHRGSSARAPENTLAAFRQAIADGADAIELDVRLSRDGMLMVMHDARLDRTTDGRGKVEETTYRDLRRLSAGRWFSSRFAAERIPALQEVFELVDGRTGINIEIKTNPRLHSPHDVVEKCLKAIDAAKAHSLALISSFHHPYVRQAAHHRPAVSCGVLHHPVKHFRKTPYRLASGADAGYFICNRTSVRRRIVHNAHAHQIKVAVYTINTRWGLERCIRFGVDAVFTDDPGEMMGFFTL